MATKASTWQTLRAKFPAEEYVLIAEVSDASGFNRSRSLDFMLINLWNSRGLAVTGIEQKSNRSDWLKELKTPAKQENHFKYCDYFFLLTDKEGVAKIDEIPANWGWYHINANGMLKTLKAAPKLESIPIQRSLLCAMLRRAADKTNYIHVDSVAEHIATKAEQLKGERNYKLEAEANNWRIMKPIIDEFEKVSGVRISETYSDIKDIGEAVKQIRQGGLEQFLKRFSRITEDVKTMHDRMIDSHKKMQDYINQQTKELNEA